MSSRCCWLHQKPKIMLSAATNSLFMPGRDQHMHNCQGMQARKNHRSSRHTFSASFSLMVLVLALPLGLRGLCSGRAGACSSAWLAGWSQVWCSSSCWQHCSSAWMCVGLLFSLPSCNQHICPSVSATLFVVMERMSTEETARNGGRLIMHDLDRACKTSTYLAGAQEGLEVG